MKLKLKFGCIFLRLSFSTIVFFISIFFYSFIRSLSDFLSFKELLISFKWPFYTLWFMLGRRIALEFVSFFLAGLTLGYSSNYFIFFLLKQKAIYFLIFLASCMYREFSVFLMSFNYWSLLLSSPFTLSVFLENLKLFWIYSSFSHKILKENSSKSFE